MLQHLGVYEWGRLFVELAGLVERYGTASRTAARAYNSVSRAFWTGRSAGLMFRARELSEFRYDDLLGLADGWRRESSHTDSA